MAAAAAPPPASVPEPLLASAPPPPPRRLTRASAAADDDAPSTPPPPAASPSARRPVRRRERSPELAAAPPSAVAALRRRLSAPPLPPPPPPLPPPELRPHPARSCGALVACAPLRLRPGDCAALQRVAVAHAATAHLNNPGEPPLFCWLYQLGRRGGGPTAAGGAAAPRRPLSPCWLAAQPPDALFAATRLLDVADGLAADAASLFGLRLGAAVFAVLNVWLGDARGEEEHDDGRALLTLLLRVRRGWPDCGQLQLAHAGGWVPAFGGGGDEEEGGCTAIALPPGLPHRVTAGKRHRPGQAAPGGGGCGGGGGGDARLSAEARLSLVAVYRTAPL